MMYPEIKGKLTTKETKASIVLADLEQTAKRASELVQLVAERTSSVSSPAQPSGEEGYKNVSLVMPPLFSRIGELTAAINDSLSDIQDNMNRIEL